MELLKKSSRAVCTSAVVVSSDPFSTTPLTSSTVGTSENTEGVPDDPEQADEDIQMEYFSEWLYSSSIGPVTRLACQNFGHCRYCLIIWNIQ